MNEIIKKLSVSDIMDIKQKAVNLINQFFNINNEIDIILESLHGYRPYTLHTKFDMQDSEGDKTNRYLDRICWHYLVKTFEFQKYMLCSDYDKMLRDIENFDIPEFNIINANEWLKNIKQLIYENVNKLVKQVFNLITEQSYYTGSSYSTRKKKKRNNNGIDSIFILTTYDYNRIFSYSYRPTITDDLEKVCYLLSGEKLPKYTCHDVMKSNKTDIFENQYFKLKVYKNGNTHYWLNDDIRDKLNLYGSGKGVIGENIRIKVLEKEIYK